MFFFGNHIPLVQAIAASIVMHYAVLVYIKDLPLPVTQIMTPANHPKEAMFEVSLITTAKQEPSNSQHGLSGIKPAKFAIATQIKKKAVNTQLNQSHVQKIVVQNKHISQREARTLQSQLAKKTTKITTKEKIKSNSELAKTLKPTEAIASTSLYTQENIDPETKPKAIQNNLPVAKKVSLMTQQTLAKKPEMPSIRAVTDLPPLIKSKQPDYPEEARWEERIGNAILKFKISSQGGVLEPHITKSSGHRDLDLAAVQAIQEWRFDYHDKQVSNEWYQYSFRFELN